MNAVIENPAVDEVVESHRTYVVSEANLDAAKAIVAKVNRKAARYGLSQYELAVSPLRMLDVKDGNAVVGQVGVYDVEIVGEQPGYEGWSFVAALDYVDGGGVITRPVPGVDVDLSAHRARPAECDHCQKNRHRSATYVWQHADGRVMQVGSSCLVPFAGIRAPGLAWLDGDPLSELSELDDSWSSEGGGGRVQYLPVDEVLMVTMAVEQVEGWVSKAAAGFGKLPTSSLVLDYMIGTDKGSRAFQTHLREAADWAAAEAKAAKVKAWAAENDGSGEWIENLRTLVAGEHVGLRHIGLLASAVAGYNRAEGIRVEREQRVAPVFVGEPGAKGPKGRIELVGEVVHLTRMPGYGYYSPDRELVLIRGEVAGQPALLKWWASSPQGFEIGAKVKGSAAVKGHETYKGEAQTVILRAKLDAVE